jgi:alkanesulfonate monooxygenase SsuD/methylene tetrahydromethanopterin reductase-like flavin-dependent oxidoreductase (luciferase family)
MLLGLQLFSFAWPHHQAQLGDTLGLIAQRAERAGLYSFWMPDHFFQVPAFGRMEDPMLEGWSTLAFVAGRTNRIKLGTMVSGVTYRHPGVLVKLATTLDVLSQGRSYFGLGAAWYEAEHTGARRSLPVNDGAV